MSLAFVMDMMSSMYSWIFEGGGSSLRVRFGDHSAPVENEEVPAFEYLKGRHSH